MSFIKEYIVFVNQYLDQLRIIRRFRVRKKNQLDIISKNRLIREINFIVH